jgi:hypothetical protein
MDPMVMVPPYAKPHCKALQPNRSLKIIAYVTAGKIAEKQYCEA